MATRGRKPTADSMTGEARCELLALGGELLESDREEFEDYRRLAGVLREMERLAVDPRMRSLVDEARRMVIRLQLRDLRENRGHRVLFDLADLVSAPVPGGDTA